jgi:hypothetical protein
MAAALLGLFLAAQTVQVQPPDAPTVDPLAVFSGDWQVVNTITGEVVQNCSRAQSFEVTPDRSTLVLTERWADNWTARYRVVHSEPNRILLFIENETRRTQAGDPVLWWAYFDGPDRFRWRRYDWPSNGATPSEWRRCPAT